MVHQSSTYGVMADDNGRATFLGGLAAVWAKQCLLRNFMVSIMVLSNSFCCVHIVSYKGMHWTMHLCPLYWTLAIKGILYFGRSCKSIKLQSVRQF